MKFGLKLINLEQLLFKKAALILFMCNATGTEAMYTAKKMKTSTKIETDFVVWFLMLLLLLLLQKKQQ